MVILEYVNDQNPVPSDEIIDLVFEPIKQQLKRDLKDWERIREERSKIGRIGGIKSGETRRTNQTKQTLHERSKTKQTQANEAVNVTVSVNDNVRENTAALPEFRIEECLTVAMNDERWVNANKATIIDLKEFNKLLERRGHYKKNPADYKSHFANWKTGGKKESFFDSREPVQNLNGHLKKL